MEELITRISTEYGLKEAKAEKVIGLILGFMQKEGPQDEVGKMMDAFPGAQSLIDKYSGKGMLGGLLGGGAMAMATKLMGMGLGMDTIKGVGGVIMGDLREKIGEEAVEKIIGGIPGGRNFV